MLLAAACGDSETSADPPQILFTQNSSGAVLTDTTLTLTGVSSQTSWFTDRPYRAAGQIPTEVFVASWGEGEDSFAGDPPNGEFTCTVDGEVVDYAVELNRPRLDGGDLVYDVEFLGDSSLPVGTPANCTTEASLFIDPRLFKALVGSDGLPKTCFTCSSDCLEAC